MAMTGIWQLLQRVIYGRKTAIECWHSVAVEWSLEQFKDTLWHWLGRVEFVFWRDVEELQNHIK